MITISIIVAIIAIILFICLLYVHAHKRRYTEKRFNIIALWTCSSIVSSYLCYIFNAPPWQLFISQTNPSSPLEKILATLVVFFFVHKISTWAREWNGLYTKVGYEALNKGLPPSMLVDGLSETVRIIMLRPDHVLSDKKADKDNQLILPKPISVIPFHEQVRDLILGKWTEYIISDTDWIEEAKCWRGMDSSVDMPLLVVCVLNENELDIERIRQQVDHDKNNNIKVIVVFESNLQVQNLENRFGDLVKYVTCYSFDEFVLKTLPLERYKLRIEKEFKENRLPNAEFSLSDIFVETKICRQVISSPGKLINEENSQDLSEFVASWVSASGSQHVALLGDYGQGKSTAALELTYRILHDAEAASKHGNRIPLLIRLTGLSPSTTTLEDLLGAWGTSYGLNGRALLALHRAGRTILIFDAFDEMASVANRADRFNHFGALWRYACTDSKIMFTGRPNFFFG